MSIVISREERDALYNRIALRLNGIDAVYNAVEAENWGAAQRLGEEFSDLLRLVCSDLGWGERADAQLTLATPPDVLRRAAGTLRRTASFEREHREAERDEAAQEVDEAKRLEETCKRILGDLGAG
jgi:hypothetical protein